MTGTAHSLAEAVFAMRQALANWNLPDILSPLVYLTVTGILLWDLVSSVGARLRYEENGRSGKIYFENRRSRFDMYWEFGGGDTLAVIDVPSEAEWVSRTGCPLPSVLRSCGSLRRR